MVGGDDFLDHGALAFGPLDVLELLLELRNAAISEFAGALIFAATLRIGEFHPQLVELGLEFLRVRQLVLFALPATGQFGRRLLELSQLLLQFLEAVLRARIGFLLERSLLGLEPFDFALDRVQRFWLGGNLHLTAGGRLVDQVDRLVGQEPVGDVPVRQGRRRDQRCVGDAHAVMRFVFLLQAAQDRDRVFDGRLADVNGLEAARQCRILLDVLLVLVERGRADAVQFAARQRRLEQVRRIHRAVGLAGTDQGMHLVDEQDDAAVG